MTEYGAFHSGVSDWMTRCYTVYMDIASFDKEKILHDAHGDVVCGVDEAGRGPLAGPVVAAACAVKDVSLYRDAVATQNSTWRLVRDSKSLSEKQREEAYVWICDYFHVGVGISTPATIDRINILQATFLAMKKAVQDMAQRMASVASADAHRGNTQLLLLIDGNQKIANCSYAQHCVPRGDTHVKSIAAASIIAKVTRDRMMIAYDKQYPLYGFATHKGYGTAAHMNALRTHGATPIHRKSFAPVALCVQ